MLVTIGVGIGTVIVLYSIFTMITGRSYLFGGNTDRYTDASIRLFARLSGAVELILGIAVVVFAFGLSAAVSVIVSWVSASVIWIAVAGIITLYLTIPVKKRD